MQLDAAAGSQSTACSEVDRAWFIESVKSKVNTRSRLGEVEELRRPVVPLSHWARKQLPKVLARAVLSASDTKVSVNQKASGKKSSAKRPQQHSSLLPGLYGVHPSDTAELTETFWEMAWGFEERAGEGVRKSLWFQWNMEKYFSSLTSIS